MQTYKLTPGSKIVIVLLIIGAVAALAYGLKSMHQTESDCSLSETYNSSAGKCVIKTGQQYANELSKIDAEKTAADTEIKRRNGTLCIPAADASKYIGVSGCVRMIVKHYYVESYGWVWLDAGDPLYAGVIVDPHTGELLPAAHKAIITADEYDKIQDLLGRRGMPRLTKRDKNFPLRGFLKCRQCGCAITAEEKTKKLKCGKELHYRYYRCTHKRGCCKQGAIQEMALNVKLMTCWTNMR